MDYQLLKIYADSIEASYDVQPQPDYDLFHVGRDGWGMATLCLQLSWEYRFWQCSFAQMLIVVK